MIPEVSFVCVLVSEHRTGRIRVYMKPQSSLSMEADWLRCASCIPNRSVRISCDGNSTALLVGTLHAIYGF